MRVAAAPTSAPPPATVAVTQAPALPGAAPISANDRVYTADQDSNTVTVINPQTNTVLGTIALGKPRMDTDADVLVRCMTDRSTCTVSDSRN